jgi:hypothetical protein
MKVTVLKDYRFCCCARLRRRTARTRHTDGVDKERVAAEEVNRRVSEMAAAFD